MRLETAVLALVVLSLSACDGAAEVPFAVAFEGLVGSEPASCGGVYSGVGTTATDLTLGDLRVYVHDVRAVTDDGRELPVSLEQDGVWQYEDVALLDFESAGPDCPMGTVETNTSIRGTLAETDAAIVGVRFRLGVPEELNHDDVTLAPAPLNLQSMFWSWNGGHKFLRIDARTTGLPDGLFVHLGSTGCEGDDRGNVTGCVQANRPEIEVTGFDPSVGSVAIDVGALLAQSDMDSDLGGAPGCMSGFDDPDCREIFHNLGLPFDGDPPTGSQTLFRAVE